MKRKKRPSMADRADRHELYERSVQCPESEIDFVDQTFSALRRRKARRLREDFCGTGATTTEWVRRRRTNVGFGVDLDPEVLAWGEEHHRQPLGKAASRLELLQADVLGVRTEPVDIVLAMNFSYWLFQQRKVMRRYFRRVRDSLVEDGIFMLDAYGGYASYKVCREKTEHDGFTYIWDQASYDPVSGEMECHIHFKFTDGSRLRRAFSYTWRVWTLPELRELLSEAGFSEVDVYWQGADEVTGEGNGIFERVERGEPDPAWIVYIVARK